MTETIISLVSEAKKSKYSLIPQISEDGKLIWYNYKKYTHSWYFVNYYIGPYYFLIFCSRCFGNLGLFSWLCRETVAASEGNERIKETFVKMMVDTHNN